MMQNEDKEFLDIVNTQLKAGVKQIDIATQLGISPATLQQRCNKLGFTIAKRLIPIRSIRINRNQVA